jgi:FMN-dependent NADH-azoreductase
MDCEDLVKIAKDNVFSLKIRQVRRVCEEEETFSSDDESYHEDGIVEFVPPSKAGMVSSRRGHTSRREVPEESLNYHVVDYLKFILALPNLKVNTSSVLVENDDHEPRKNKRYFKS